VHRKLNLVCVVMVLVGAVTALGLSACGSSSSSSSTSAGGETSSSGSESESDPGASLLAGTPAPTGELDKLTWNIGGEPSSIDPAQAHLLVASTVVSNMCEGLLRQGPEGPIVAGLASSAHPSPVEYVYTLRNGVTFWDGTPVTAEDVAFSLNRQLDPKVASQWAGTFINVKSIEVTGPREVTVTLKQPDVLFNEEMASPAGAVIEKAYAESKGSSLGSPDGGIMCTGPFEFKSWNKGASMLLERYDGYWDKAHAAHAKSLEFSFLTTDSTVTNAALSGQIDGTYDVPFSAVSTLTNSSAGSVYQGKTYEEIDLSFVNVPTGPLKDPRLRRAIEKAIDYHGILSAVLADQGQVVKTPAAPGTWGYAEDVFQAGYEALPERETDVAAAKALVEQAGAPSGPVNLLYPTGAEFAAQIANEVANAGKEIGIDIALKPVPLQTYLGFFYGPPQTRDGYAMILSLEFASVPDPLDEYSQRFFPGSPGFYSNYPQPTIMSALGKARATAAPAARAKLINTAQEQMAEDPTIIPIATSGGSLFMSNKVTGATPAFVHNYYPWAAEVGAP
jgi:peptide/nickel transport system substrate-binding protein